MIKSLISYNLFFWMTLTPIVTYATVTAWRIIPAESNLTFTGTQNAAPVTGGFKNFTGVIHFDPTQLNKSNVKMTIDMNSVSTSYKDLEDTLKTSSWFNIQVFPQAIFEANHFIKVGEDKYEGNGMLTIRDKKVPVTIHFTAKKLSADKTRVTGNTTLKRSDFGVGQGEWASTKEIKDNVQVNFTVTAMKSST